MKTNSICRFITGNEVNLLRYVQTPTYRGECSVPLPEFMGTLLQATRGKIAINPLSGMPVVVFPYIHNGVNGLLETDDQRLIFAELKTNGLGQEFLHQLLNAPAKLLPSFEGTNEGLVAGLFADMGSLETMDVAVAGDIHISRNNELVNDPTMKYIYNELASINGFIDQQVTDETTARMLFRSGLDKASEALNPLKGDGLQGVLRRQTTLDSIMLFQYNKNPQAFLQMVQEFIAAVHNGVQTGASIQTSTMKQYQTGDKLLLDKTVLAKAIQEEADAQRQLFALNGGCPKQVNQIDEAFILEILNSLNNPDKPSLATSVLNTEVFSTNAIQAGAKMVSMLSKTAKGSIKTDNNIIPFFPEAVSPIDFGDRPAITKFAGWLANKTGQDMSQLAMTYFAETSPTYVNGANNDTLFGINNNVPVTAESLIFGNNPGQPVATPNNPNGIPSVINDAILKLAGNAGVHLQPNAPTVQAPFQMTPVPQTQPFGQVLNNQQNLINQYNNSMNTMMSQNTNQNQNSGGNNMFLSNAYNQPANLVEVVVSSDPSQVYVVNPQMLVNTPYGQAATIYTKAGLLAGYAVMTSGVALNAQMQPAGSVQVYQVPVQAAPTQFAQYTQPQPQFGQPQFGMPASPAVQYNYGQQPPQLAQFAQPQFTQQQYAQPMFNQYGAVQQPSMFNQYTQPQLAQFGQGEVRPNPVAGMGQKVMQFI